MVDHALSPSQLGEVSLDAALQIEDFLAGRSLELSTVGLFLKALRAPIERYAVGVPLRVDLTYLPVYESVVETVDGTRPNNVIDFSRLVLDTLGRLGDAHAHAKAGSHTDMLEQIRDLCLAVHDRLQADRMDAITNSQQPAGNFAYATA